MVTKNLPKVEFVKSVDSVCKGNDCNAKNDQCLCVTSILLRVPLICFPRIYILALGLLSATIDSPNQIDKALEAILNVLFYIVVAVVSSLPWTLVLLLSSFRQ